MDALNFDELHNLPASEINFSELIKSCSVDLSVEMPKPEILISIGTHKYKGFEYDTAALTAGEFSAIVAQSKAKKTFLKSALIASYIGGQSSVYFPNIKTHRDKDYTILDFDTEQGKYYTQRTFRRVIEMVGHVYDGYKGYATRHLSSDERLKLIDHCITNQEALYKEPIKLVSIDGIADMVENTNDIELSKQAADYVLKWTDVYNIHIISVIHKSSVTNKPLGHLGTFVLKKAENVINLDKGENDSILVTNPYSRGYPFDEFSFKINTDALPYLVE